MKSRTRYKLECYDILGKGKATLGKMRKNWVDCIFGDPLQCLAHLWNASVDAVVHPRELLQKVEGIGVGNLVPSHGLYVGQPDCRRISDWPLFLDVPDINHHQTNLMKMIRVTVLASVRTEGVKMAKIL